MPSIKPDPYCRFKTDRELRLALLVRECRIALVAMVGVIAAALVRWHGWF